MVSDLKKCVRKKAKRLNINLFLSASIMSYSDMDAMHGRNDHLHLLMTELICISPGRFFVANELKAMLAHVLLNYDIKMADGRGRPENWQFGIYTGPDMKAKILFRKRRA